MNASIPAPARSGQPPQLPDFRNLGVMLRILLGVNAGMVFAATLQVRSLGDVPRSVAELSAWVEPVLLVTVLLLYTGARALLRLPYAAGAACIVLLAVVLTAAYSAAMRATGMSLFSSEAHWSLHAAWAAGASALLLGYFHLRNQAFSPALAEARLQALQARIRPHFLFNSLNAVLSLMRSDPRRAESALEDLAELFRTLMADNRALTTLAEEVALTRHYLELEHLRLGERLKVDWRINPRAEGAAVPPLMLQPLVENAVYHGVEPGLGAGTIAIAADVEGEQMKLTVSNPYHPDYQHRQGNRMALANIGERLRLHFDVEAQLLTRIDGERFEITVSVPLRKPG
jgi:two-component system sensor histidine kinase AlgZ